MEELEGQTSINELLGEPIRIRTIQMELPIPGCPRPVASTGKARTTRPEDGAAGSSPGSASCQDAHTQGTSR